MEGEQVILESLGTPPWLARRAVLAYRQDVARAANWALDSGARHKAVHVEPQPLAPVDLQQAFDNAVDGSMLTVSGLTFVGYDSAQRTKQLAGHGRQNKRLLRLYNT